MILSHRFLRVVLAGATLAISVWSQPPLPLSASSFTGSNPSVPSVPAASAQPTLTIEMRGDIFMARKMYREAIDAYRKGDPNSAVLNNKIGIAFHQMLQLDHAKKSYEKAIKINPSYAEAINNLGTIYYAGKSYRRAVGYYKRALRFEPNSASIMVNLGSAYFSRHEFEKASELYSKALAADPEVFERRSQYGELLQERSIEDRAKFHLYLAKTYAKAGENERALSYLRKALEEGVKEREKIPAMPEFATLKTEPAFLELMASAPSRFEACLQLKNVLAKRPAALIAVALVLASLSCSRPGSSGLTRVGIVPATLLTSDTSLNWAGIGLAVVAFQDLATSHKYVPMLVNSDSIARRAQAKYILRSSVETRNGKYLLTATLTDLATQQDLAHAAVQGLPVEGFITLANELMKRIDPGAGEFSTRNDNALAAYSQAMATSNGQQKMEGLGRAIQADAAFGLAYLTLMDSLNAQDQQQLKTIAERAGAHRAQFVPLDRARLDLVMRRLSQSQPKEIESAVHAVLALSPGDVPSLMMLAQLAISENKPDEAIGRLREVLSLDATNLQARQLLAAALLNTRQEGAAIRTIEELRALRPDDPNVARTLAEIQFSTGHVAEAEKTFLSSPEPSAAVGVAICRLLAGDPAGANIEVEKYAASRQADPLLPFTRATFAAAEGDRGKAIAILTSAELAGPELHSVGLSQAAILQAMARNYSAARALSDSALPLAQARVPKIFSIVGSLIAHADEPAAQFEALVRASPLDPPGQKVTSGYAYFISGRYESALPVWQQLWKTNPGDVHSQLMVAAAENRLGKTADAVKTAPRMFLPNFSGGDQFAVVTFGEMLRLKAATAQVAGDARLAEQFNKLVAMYKL